MSKYFSNYPLTQYQGKVSRDITRRSKIRDDLFQDPYIFLPYTVREGEKPETIAELYYGSVDSTWLVLYANNMTDPYYDWPMDGEEFNQYFIEKYSEISGKQGVDVIRWGQDKTRTDNIVYYYKTIDKDIGSEQFTFSTGSTSFADVTDEEIDSLLENEVITINGIQYRLVKE